MNPNAAPLEHGNAGAVDMDEQQPLGAAAQDQAQVDETKVDQTLLDRIVDETTRHDLDQAMARTKIFELQQRRAKLYAASGLFQSDNRIASTSTQALAIAMVKIELGESMGFGPAEALAGIHVINGQTSISAALRAARMQASGWDWDIQWHQDADRVCTGCRLWLKFKGHPYMEAVRDDNGNPVIDPQTKKPQVQQVSVEFLKADALRLKTKIWEGPQGRRTSRDASVLEKDNWKNSPRNMYFARAVTNAQRFYAPKVLSANLMSTEEAMDMEETGNGWSMPAATPPKTATDFAQPAVPLYKAEPAKAAGMTSAADIVGNVVPPAEQTVAEEVQLEPEEKIVEVADLKKAAAGLTTADFTASEVNHIWNVLGKAKIVTSKAQLEDWLSKRKGGKEECLSYIRDKEIENKTATK